MPIDAQGLPVTAEKPQTVAAIDGFVAQFLDYGTDLMGILAAAEADPDCALAQAHAAALMLFMETGESAAKAKPFLGAGTLVANNATERERLYLWAIANWAQGDVNLAQAAFKAIAGKYPRDLMAAKVGQILALSLGDSAGILALGEAVLPANADNHLAHGMVAFGLEQCHRLAEAEAAGRKATEMCRKSPWAHHAVAHVMETQGRVDEGIAWMTGLADTWEHCNSFMYCHNWWHTALFHLDRDSHAEALALYDTRIWGRLKEYSQDQIGAVSMLARLELRGVDVGQRWQDVAGYLALRLHEHVDPFLDLHYIYGLARAGRDAEAAEMLISVARHAGKAKPVRRPVWLGAALPAAEGLIAYAMGQFDRAADRLGAALPHLFRVGGSHAQRDLFDQIHLDALIRADRHGEARAILDRRLAARPNIAVTRRWLQRLAA
jgi:tetratricopeptide (TPR) repeat protein